MTPDLGPIFPKFLTPGPKEKRRIPPESTPVSSEISDLCEISDFFLFFSYFAYQNKDVKSTKAQPGGG